MIDINKHPVWKGVSPVKKPFHLLRIKLAKQYAKFIPQEKFVGITGSVGKTTTTLATKAVLSTKFETISTAPRLDMIFNLPITILKTSPKIQKVVLEMGIEYKGEMDFYLSMIRPATGVVTCISAQHSEFLGSEEEIAEEKGKLIESLPKNGFAILNHDDPLTKKMASKTVAQVIFFGTDKEGCDIWASDLRIEDFRLKFGLNFGVERVEVHSKLLGLHMVYPLLAAAAVGLSADIPLMKIKKALETVEPPEHRLQALSGFNGSVILDDTYNAAPISIEGALDTLSRVSARRRIAVLGEMRELGPLTKESYQKVAHKIFKEKPDLVMLGTGDTKYITDELLKLGFLPEKIEPNLKNPEIISKLLKILSKGDVALIKGARAVRLDEVVARVIKPD